MGAFAAGQKLVRQPVRECPCRVQVVVLEVGRRDLDAEVSVPVFARPEVAEQRQQGAHLAALVAEVDAIGEDAAALGPEPAHGLQVVTPVPAATDGSGERRAF